MSTQGSTSIDYDYQKAYGVAPSVSDVSGSQEDRSVSKLVLPSDDLTLDAVYETEGQFEVLAPSGLLGLILETSPDNGVFVNGIKQTSVLADQLRPGDKLISMDDEDVTWMQAAEASRLIASKKNQVTRKLVFMRPTRSSQDSEYEPDP